MKLRGSRGLSASGAAEADVKQGSGANRANTSGKKRAHQPSKNASTRRAAVPRRPDDAGSSPSAADEKKRKKASLQAPPVDRTSQRTNEAPQPRELRYFLFKSEPDDFSVDQLAKEGPSCWDGVRNYQARNVMQSMRVGDRAFFYHSSCKVPGIVGIVQVLKEAYPDHTALDPDGKYYDPKSTKDNPRWFMVDVELVRKLGRCITLEELKGLKGSSPVLSEMILLNRGRLSVQPVSVEEWEFILGLE